MLRAGVTGFCRGWLVGLALLLAGATTVRAQGGTSTGTPQMAAVPRALAKARAVSILFVGNSFTHGGNLPLRKYNAAAVEDEDFGLPRPDPRHESAAEGPHGGIPGIFQKFTVEKGLFYEVHEEAVSASPLEFHYRHALPMIAQAKWDVVVLQDYSTGPLPVRRGGHPERFLRSATRLEQAVHAANRHARLYLYETWPRADLTFLPKGPYFGEGIETMADDLHRAYYQEAAENGSFAGVAPVGDAWMRAIRAGVAQTNPLAEADGGKIDLWWGDHYHPSARGAYLAALVLFQEITGKDVRTLGADERAAADLGISPADATTLQRLAYEQVSGEGEVESPVPEAGGAAKDGGSKGR